MSAPWMKFYPSDWRADPALRMCSIAARGLWMEMLCVMHEATPYGSLRAANGNQVTERQLAALAGGSVDEVTELLVELEEAGVLSRDADGVIVSRRMQRDKAKADADKANGKRGGNPTLRDGVNPPDKQEDKAQKPEARSQSSSLRSDDPAARKRVRPERLAEDWSLPEGWGQDAIDVGLPAHLIDLEAAKMRDWSRSSKNGAKLDWRATWRNWCREAIGRLPPARGSPQRPETTADVAARLLTEMRSANGQPGTSDSRHPQALVAIPGGKHAGVG